MIGSTSSNMICSSATNVVDSDCLCPCCRAPEKCLETALLSRFAGCGMAGFARSKGFLDAAASCLARNDRVGTADKLREDNVAREVDIGYRWNVKNGGTKEIVPPFCYLTKT